MPLAISIDRLFHRFDSTDLPTITITGAVDPWTLQIADWVHIYNPVTSTFLIQLPNRTMAACPLTVRQLTVPTWVLDTGITGSGTGPLVKSGSSTFAWEGGYYNTALSATNCSIEAKPGPTIEEGSGISLQDGTIDHVYSNPGGAAHALAFGGGNSSIGGRGFIREKGMVPPKNAYFKWEVGDKGLIELNNGIVRYYLIKADGSMNLLRTTRSKLTAAPKAEVMLYSPNATLNEIGIHSNNQASTTIDMYGVLENFQDWFNDFVHTSTADAIQMANNENEYTFANAKRNVKVLSASLNVRTKIERDDFLEFWEYHGNEREFIYVDEAHTDRSKNPTEFFAQFSSPFADKSRASCLSSLSATITETYRNDYIPKLVIPGPSVPATAIYYGDDIILYGLDIVLFG